MSIFSSYNKYWLFAENVDFSSPIQHLFPSKLWIFLSKPQIVLSKTSELVKRHVSENMNLRFLGHLFLSFRASPWGGGEISPNATSRLRDSSSVRCRNMMWHGSCSLAGRAWARAAKQLPDSTVMTLPNGSTVFKWEDLAPVLIIHHS